MLRPEPFAIKRHLASSPAPIKAQIDEITHLLLTAAKPLVLYGSGTSTRALSLLLEIANQFAIPVVSTPRAKGKGPRIIPDILLGNTGIAATPVVDQFINSNHFDVVLVLGAGLNSYATNSWDPALMPSRAMIQIDMDPGAIGRIFPVDIGVVADTTLFCEMLHTALALHGR